MKVSRWLSGLLAVAALVLGGAVVTPAPVGAQAKPVVWNLPHVAAPTYYHTLNYTAFANKVKEKSGGRMEIRVHPASSLYPSHELIPALVDGRGADIVVEVVGIAAATVEGLDMVRFNGKFVDIGNIVPQPVSFPATKVITNQIQWRGLMHYNPWIMPAALDFLVRTKDRYPLSKVISHSFPLAEINKAFEFAEWQGKGAGTAAMRVILKP